VLLATLASRCAGGSSGSDSNSLTGPTHANVACPAAVLTQSTAGQPVAVTFENPNTAGAVPPVTVSCEPPSGTSFPVGTTTVTCTATDSRQQTFSCNFTVKVQGPPRLSTSTILAFGDSLTFGSSPPDAPDSYPDHLKAKLAARYVGQTITVINDGRPGENAQATGRTRFPSALDIYHPGVVLLMEGSNDLLGGDAGVTAGLAALTEMVRGARARNVTVLLATLPPQRLGGVRNGVALMIPGFNEKIAELARQESVMLVDVYTAMGGDGRYIGRDDEHPTPEGFEVMAQAFFAAIQQTVEMRQ
jgi:lysophospholipase L1-like esterase